VEPSAHPTPTHGPLVQSKLQCASVPQPMSAENVVLVEATLHVDPVSQLMKAHWALSQLMSHVAPVRQLIDRQVSPEQSTVQVDPAGHSQEVPTQSRTMVPAPPAPPAPPGIAPP
jgi:hypothetical protein